MNDPKPSEGTNQDGRLVLRDHSLPCEHGKLGSHQYGNAGVRHSGQHRQWCPGGKEIRMRQAPIIDSYRTYDIPQYIEAKVYIGQVLNQKYLWVEVDGQ